MINLVARLLENQKDDYHDKVLQKFIEQPQICTKKAPFITLTFSLEDSQVWSICSEKGQVTYQSLH